MPVFVEQDNSTLLIIAGFAAELFLLLLKQRSHHPTRQRRRYAPTVKFLRSGLLHPRFHSTPWQHMLRCGTETEFLVATSFPRSLAFRDLIPWFSAARSKMHHSSPFRRTATTRGRKALSEKEDLLGLVLWYLKGGDVEYALCPIFGITASSLSQWLEYGMEVMNAVVSDDTHSCFQIRWPTVHEMRKSSNLLLRNRLFGYELRGVFAVSDGARMSVPDFDDPDTQNAFYNAMTQRVEATSLLVWNFKGGIIHAGLNFPGSWYDSRLAYVSGLYWPSLALDSNTPPGFAVLGESAFVNDTRTGKVVRAQKVNVTRNYPISNSCVAIELALQRIYPSERQSAEWGVRGVKGPFCRLTRTLPGDHYKRGRWLSAACRLVNYRTRVAGLNEISSVYGRDPIFIAGQGSHYAHHHRTAQSLADAVSAQ